MISIARSMVFARGLAIAIAAVTFGAFGAACAGQTPLPPPAVVLSFNGCTYEGMLTMTMASAPARVFTTGVCGATAYDGAGNGTAVDLGLSLGGSPGGGEGVTLTFVTAVANQSINSTAAPADLVSDNLLGAEVPAGTVWARHRFATMTLAAGYATAQGGITFGALDVTPINCTADWCKEGTASFDVTLTHVVWSTKNGPVDVSGHVIVTASARDESCPTTSGCKAGEACNQIGYQKNYGGIDVTSIACGPANPSGAALGTACTAASDCASGYCDLHAFTCASFCATDADCDASTACVQSYWEGSANVCLRRCATDADCAAFPQAKTCVAHGNGDRTKLVGVCGGSAGTTPFGMKSTSTYQGDCASELALLGTCTRYCASNADCAPPLPSCAVAAVPSSQTKTGKGQICGM
jgi:hypothetical protein